ncbi:MAG TPA: hypothetical protein VNC23_07295 [Lapillicoccus sp.]|nr:hypothetical protein [Lapillicoccus sp.]
MIVIFISAAWSSAATRCGGRSVRAGPGLAALGQVTTQITGIRWRLLTCPVATLDDGGGVMGERVALVRRGTYRI